MQTTLLIYQYTLYIYIYIYIYTQTKLALSLQSILNRLYITLHLNNHYKVAKAAKVNFFTEQVNHIAIELIALCNKLLNKQVWITHTHTHIYIYVCMYGLTCYSLCISAYC